MTETPDGCTFTNDEIKKLAAYFNFVQDNATFTISAKAATDFYKMAADMVAHIRKCEGYIFEFIKEVKKPDPPKPVGRPKGKK